MIAAWYALAAAALALYVVLDGFDLGAGALHLHVAKSDRERRQVLAAIGPFWDGNEVWLLAAGGVLFLAFPKALAAGLSGFYLAIMFLLWTLILRGVAIELRSHVADPMWRSFWDAMFALSSSGAAILLGAALGNVVRGVPLSVDGWFALPLFASFSPTGELGILDVYTVLAGVLALTALAHHGALFLAWRTDGAVRDRALRAASGLFPAVVGLWIATSLATAAVAPGLLAELPGRPLALAATALFLAGLATSAVARRRGRDRAAFLGSCAFLGGLFAATAATSYPVLLAARPDPTLSLTAAKVAASSGALRAGLYWWPAGAALALVYLMVLFRLHRGKAAAASDGEGY